MTVTAERPVMCKSYQPVKLPARRGSALASLRIAALLMFLLGAALLPARADDSCIACHDTESHKIANSAHASLTCDT